jgi:hypothetical protein
MASRRPKDLDGIALSWTLFDALCDVSLIFLLHILVAKRCRECAFLRKLVHGQA